MLSPVMCEGKCVFMYILIRVLVIVTCVSKIVHSQLFYCILFCILCTMIVLYDPMPTSVGLWWCQAEYPLPGSRARSYRSQND